MKYQQILGVVVGAVLVLAVGYWWGHASRARPPTAAHSGSGTTGTVAGRDSTPGSPVPPKDRRVLYYRNAMGLDDTSPVPK